MRPATPPPAAEPALRRRARSEPSGGGLVLTLSGDSRVFRYDLVADTSALLHDFGGLGIARDLILRDSTLFAVVGGTITVAFDSTIGETGQRDLDGTVLRVDLHSGTTTSIDHPATWCAGLRSRLTVPTR